MAAFSIFQLCQHFYSLSMGRTNCLVARFSDCFQLGNAA
jgi:hypothetical protein